MFRLFIEAKGKTVQKRMKLGERPAMSLKEALIAAREALTTVARGEDPSVAGEARKKGFVSVADAVDCLTSAPMEQITKATTAKNKILKFNFVSHSVFFLITKSTPLQSRPSPPYDRRTGTDAHNDPS